MEKSFKPQQLYIIKSIGQTAAIIGGFVFIYFFYGLLTAKLPVVLVIIINVLLAIFGLIGLLFIVLNFLRSQPTITIGDDYIKLRHRKVPYKDIKEYIPMRGGSEAEIITTEDKRFVLELSWFRKKDREEIIEHLTKNI